MSDKRLKKASHFLISGGIICQVAALLIGHPYLRWSMSILAICLLGWGYYLNLKSKGYVPIRSGWFYGLVAFTLLPLLGPIAAARKLSVMLEHGDPVPDWFLGMLFTSFLGPLIGTLVAVLKLSLMREKSEKIDHTRPKKTSRFIIGSGLICQVAALLNGSLSSYRYWSLLAVLAICLLGWGYYANLRSKGYDPLRSGWFYGLMVLSFLPLFGPLAAAGKLRIMPVHGDPKGTRPVAHGLFLTVIAGIGLFLWLSISWVRQNATVWGHIEPAEHRIRDAVLLQEAGKDFSAELAAAETEIRAAKDAAADLKYNALNATILKLSGEAHFLRGEWKEAEQDYTRLLETGYSTDVARKRLSQLKEQRKKGASRGGNVRP